VSASNAQGVMVIVLGASMLAMFEVATLNMQEPNSNVPVSN